MPTKLKGETDQPSDKAASIVVQGGWEEDGGKEPPTCHINTLNSALLEVTVLRPSTAIKFAKPRPLPVRDVAYRPQHPRDAYVRRPRSNIPTGYSGDRLIAILPGAPTCVLKIGRASM